MILEVKKFPESQEVMDNPEWFLIMDADPNDNKLGHGSYARILEEHESTKPDEFNSDIKELNKLKKHNDDHIIQSDLEEAVSNDCMITYQDPGDENEN